ncbi:MAG: nitroreductase [Desulfurococcales archaeon ex4484_217_1]|nr:MAG: nitroreductase [Desulfurococcales archaeon ex4484_217_1]
MSLEEAIYVRRSRRSWKKDVKIPLRHVAQILWAAQGITNWEEGFRAAPSAGATYPIELYVVVKKGEVEGLDRGVYHYDPYKHCLVKTLDMDVTYELMEASLGQYWVGTAPVNLVIAAEYARTTRFYGDRGYRYVHMEVGHVGQNVYLQAEALGLGTVAIGAFYDNEVRKILGLSRNLAPLYIMPIGYPEKR